MWETKVHFLESFTVAVHYADDCPHAAEFVSFQC